MDLRAQFTTAAGHAAYTYMNLMRQLGENEAITEALRNAPIELTKGRRLEDIVLDDMMERFAAIMSPAQSRKVIPYDFYYFLMTERFGMENVTRQEADAEMEHAVQQQKGKVIPSALPTFLQILEPHITGQQVAQFANQWNEIFTKVVRLTTSDDSLRVHTRNIATQNTLVEVANGAISLKAKNAARKLGGGGNGSGGMNGADDDDGDDDDGDELTEIRKKIANLDMPEATKTTVRKLLKRTDQMPPHMSERHTNIKRLELITALPWNKYSALNTDLQSAEAILNNDHYGLDKVKERIIRHVAVQMRTAAASGKIMCLVGPPGVGKTSIAQSVAKALGRTYGRVSLGGVHDESKIRGHSSTYVGALPGIIIEGVKNAGSANPLMVLDEIDKMGQESRQGDPTAALLEVLDPAQNHTFRDDFMGVEFDLSKVFFFATANDLGTIPGPLRDRMQIIGLPGYMPAEKFEIATRFLLPKQMKQKGLSTDDFVLEPEALTHLISHYTREAGVRGLEGRLDELCGIAVVNLAKGEPAPIRITKAALEKYLGPGFGDRDQIPAVDSIGVVNGLAYSSVGGSVLPIEASIVPSYSGFRIKVTGNLGKVMGESADVAESLVRARAPQFGISDAKLVKAELRVHAPAGAVPKDGPSAGAAFTTAIISSLTGIPVRRDVAMTGEINSRGEVTAIGGLPEKLQGALAAGVKTVLVPKQNEPNLAEVPEFIRRELKIICVSTIEDVLKHALTEELKPLATPAPAERTWGTRLREAWAVVRKASNDNPPPLPRQAAGPRQVSGTPAP